jgi:hypothetical protein
MMMKKKEIRMALKVGDGRMGVHPVAFVDTFEPVHQSVYFERKKQKFNIEKK